MAKKIATSFVVEPQTDAEKLAALLTSPAPIPVQPEVIPVIPTENTPVEPTPTPVVPQSLDAAQVLAFLAANPQILQAATASKSVNVSLRPTVTKSTQKKGYVNMAFSEKPSADAIAELKAAKYRWSPFNKVWYGPGDALANHAVYGADVQSALNS